MVTRRKGEKTRKDSDEKGVFRVRQKESSFDESKHSNFSESKVAHNLHTQHRSDGDGHGIVFWIAVAASQVVGIICVALAVYWGLLFGGMGWNNNNPQQIQNLHPLLMILGLIFFYGDAIMVYRVLSFLPKFLLKIIHASLHLLAIITSSVGIAAIFENHRLMNRADLYSLHSWVGLATFSFFCLQYVGSFITFLFPGLSLSLRGRVMPFHTFLGVGFFLMAVAAAQMGLTEWMLWSAPKYSMGLRSKEANTGNTLGIFLIGFAFLVVFITTHQRYKRRPLPSEISPTN